MKLLIHLIAYYVVHCKLMDVNSNILNLISRAVINAIVLCITVLAYLLGCCPKQHAVSVFCGGRLVETLAQAFLSCVRPCRA